jgi:hypothetical protein
MDDGAMQQVSCSMKASDGQVSISAGYCRNGFFNLAFSRAAQSRVARRLTAPPGALACRAAIAPSLVLHRCPGAPDLPDSSFLNMACPRPGRMSSGTVQIK